MSSDFSTQLQSLWRARFLQKTQEARQGLQSLQQDFSNPSDWQRMEMEVLRASLLRASGEMEKSRKILKDLQKVSGELPFQFYIQQGINLFVDGEYALAFEFLVRAQKRAKGDFENLAVASNILLCLENLNFSTAEKLVEVQKYLKRLNDPEITASMGQHLMSFAQRQAFRQGQVAQVFKNADTEINQPFFYRQWVAQLPYLKSPKKLDSAELASLFVGQSLYLKNFRLKTLLSDTRLQEEEKIELREYIDRLYLWTWRWITSGEEHHHENLKECLGKFTYSSFHKKMTGEDILMLRNSLGWILLFQPENKKFIAPVMDLLATLKVQTTPIFALEELLISYLSASKNKEKAKANALAKKIRAHDLYSKSGLSFEKWMKEFSRKIQTPKTSSHGLSVNPATFKIINKTQEIVSEALVNLLTDLLDNDSLTFAEALESAFGIRGYDEDIHKVKIHNLLHRLRGILPPEMKILTRRDRIYLQGSKDGIHVVSRASTRSPLLEKSLLAGEKILSSEMKKASMDRWVHPHLVLKKAAGKKEFSRQDLQQMTQASKATTNRWIQKWLDSGLLKKAGQGKATAYLVEMS